MTGVGLGVLDRGFLREHPGVVVILASWDFRLGEGIVSGGWLVFVGSLGR